MKTKEEVREDLNEIRYYCSKQKDFENAAKTIGSSAVVEKVKTYNEAMTIRNRRKRVSGRS